MINKTTSFKKGKKGKPKFNFKKGGKTVAPEKKTKNGPKTETECFYCKGTGHWKRNCPKYLADKKADKANKGIYIYRLWMCTLLILAVAPVYLILVQLLAYVTLNRNCRISNH